MNRRKKSTRIVNSLDHFSHKITLKHENSNKYLSKESENLDKRNSMKHNRSSSQYPSNTSKPDKYSPVYQMPEYSSTNDEQREDCQDEIYRRRLKKILGKLLNLLDSTPTNKSIVAPRPIKLVCTSILNKNTSNIELTKEEEFQINNSSKLLPSQASPLIDPRSTSCNTFNLIRGKYGRYPLRSLQKVLQNEDEPIEALNPTSSERKTSPPAINNSSIPNIVRVDSYNCIESPKKIKSENSLQSETSYDDPNGQISEKSSVIDLHSGEIVDSINLRKDWQDAEKHFKFEFVPEKVVPRQPETQEPDYQITVEPEMIYSRDSMFLDPATMSLPYDERLSIDVSISESDSVTFGTLDSSFSFQPYQRAIDLSQYEDISMSVHESDVSIASKSFEETGNTSQLSGTTFAFPIDWFAVTQNDNYDHGAHNVDNNNYMEHGFH